MFKKICEFCKEPYEANVSYRKYCSSFCKNSQCRINAGTEAKDFKCLQCGIPFKRRSAKNTKCLDCREILKNVSSVKDKDIPKVDLEKDSKMINDWLKNHKVKVA